MFGKRKTESGKWFDHFSGAGKRRVSEKTEKKMREDEKLSLWQGRLSRCRMAYEQNLNRMEERRHLYDGDARKGSFFPAEGDVNGTPYLRNLVRELIEAQIDTSIPQPKVTARCKEDESKAKLIEDMIRDELNRLPMEEINDEMERTVPLQGGGFYLVGWEKKRFPREGDGDVTVRCIYPDCVIPQEGVAQLENMEYFFVLVPTTRGAVRSLYGVEIEGDGEVLPGDHRCYGEDNVTVCLSFYRNRRGRMGLFAFSGDAVLLDQEEYGERNADAAEEEQKEEDDGPECEVLSCDLVRSDGTVIAAGEQIGLPYCDEILGPTMLRPYEKVKIPRYLPKVSPLILQKCVSDNGRFLGCSDADALADAQNAVNCQYRKIVDKLWRAGSFVTLPDDATVDVTAEDMRVVRIGNAANKALVDVYNLQADVSQDMMLMREIYEEARQVVGVTDAYLGREDSTAISGVAKEISAKLAAGRLESKRAMKRAAYAHLFEAIFQYRLAYAKEPMDVPSRDEHGESGYTQFNRYDFLERDENGEYFWNDRFYFSCDTEAPLAQDRAAMWQEARMYYNDGAFGDPSSAETRAYFWGLMEDLHYPGAARARLIARREADAQSMTEEGGAAGNGTETAETDRLRQGLADALYRRAEENLRLSASKEAVGLADGGDAGDDPAFN